MHLLNAFILQRILKFGIVGGIGMGFDFSVTWLLKEKILLNKYVATSAGFITAVINNFLLNYFWTFQSNSNFLTTLGLFIAIAVAGLLLHNLVVYFFHEWLSVKFYYSKVLAVACVFCWNFTMNYLYNFHAH
jgi:putative flippase GtrA